MTHPSIKSKYIRGLFAREIMGYRTVYNRLKNSPNPMPKKELWAIISIAESVFGRVDLHMRRYPTEFFADDVTPLMGYKFGFAGHS